MSEELNQMEVTEGANANTVEAGVDTTVPNTVVDKRIWHLADGTECSKSAFIREQFVDLNKSRAEISEEFTIPYRTVYGATVNMVNAAEPTSRGRGAINPKLEVTGEGLAVVTADGKILVNGVELAEGEEKPETTLVDRNEWIKQQVEAGMSRGDVAKALNISYGVIYGLTKEAEGTRQKHEIEYQGEIISRNEYIRKRFAEGIEKSAIAKELGVEYSVVWGATKLMKSEAEKYAETIEKLEKFADSVVDADKELFTTIIADLKSIDIKVEVAQSTTDPAAGQEPDPTQAAPTE